VVAVVEVLVEHQDRLQPQDFMVVVVLVMLILPFQTKWVHLVLFVLFGLATIVDSHHLTQAICKEKSWRYQTISLPCLKMAVSIIL
jgi:hypothetical protein